MSLPVRFTPYSVLVKTAGGAVDAWINQIQSTDPSENITLFEESGGSQTDREYVAQKLIQPTVPIETTDLSMLATIGMLGVAISADDSNPGAVIYAREVANQSLPASTSSEVHVSLAISDGLIVPTSVSASENSTAKLSTTLHAFLGSGSYSGATPIVATDDVAISSGAGAVVNIYTGGVVKFTPTGGSARLVEGVAQQQVDFGLNVAKESINSQPYPSFIRIDKRYPKVTFTTKDVELITEIGDGVSVSSFAVYFTAVDQNGQRVAPSTTSHVSVTGTAGILQPTRTNLSWQKSGTVAFEFIPSLNTNLLTISTSAAIPTS